MKTRLLLARHGETDWNREGRWQGRTDVPLNDAGREQALELAERLRELAPARVVASRLVRARDTATLVAERLGLEPPRVVPGLEERTYGAFEGLTREECEARYPVEWAEWMAGGLPEPPGAEPRLEAGARVARALTELCREGTAESILAVSHGGVMRAFLLVTLGIEASPVGNGGLWSVEWSGEAFVAAEPIAGGPEGRRRP